MQNHCMGFHCRRNPDPRVVNLINPENMAQIRIRDATWTKSVQRITYLLQKVDPGSVTALVRNRPVIVCWRPDDYKDSQSALQVHRRVL